MKTEMAEQHDDKYGFIKRSDMTMRDYFAGQAIIPFMNWSLDQSQEDGDTAAIAAKRYAKSAYLIADAMLEARK